MAKFLQVGTIRKAKDSNKEYICLNQVTDASGEYHTENLVKLHRALTAFIKDPTKNGLALQLQTPKEKLEGLAKAGYLNEEQLEERKSKVPNYILKEISFVLED